MSFKRVITILLIAVLLLSVLTGCKNNEEESAFLDLYTDNEQNDSEEKLPSNEEEKEQEPEVPEKEETPLPEQQAPDVEENSQPDEPPKVEEPAPEKDPGDIEPPEAEPEEEEKEEASDPKTAGPLFSAEENPYKDSLKILAIGNSFSIDGMEYLWDIANSMGVKEVVLGNMYIGGCSLDTHYSNIKGDRPAYRYYKNTIGNWKTTEDVAISTALRDEKWDIITLQQVSEDNSKADSYNNLHHILRYIEQRKPKKDTKLLWHMTWAYQADSNRKALRDYGNDQLKMYEGVLERIRDDVLIFDDFDGVIPVGTMIQNLRTTPIGDTLTRDGYHLSKGLGRFTAALTWYCYITGADPAQVPFIPLEDMMKIQRYWDDICKSVKKAIESPYEVMQ